MKTYFIPPLFEFCTDLSNIGSNHIFVYYCSFLITNKKFISCHHQVQPPQINMLQIVYWHNFKGVLFQCSILHKREGGMSYTSGFIMEWFIWGGFFLVSYFHIDMGNGPIYLLFFDGLILSIIVLKLKKKNICKGG